VTGFRSALAPGSIGLGLSLHRLHPPAALAQMRREASAAVAAGFDGVTLSEHHAGFPGYVPNPMLMSGLLLAELDTGWAVAAPAILSLRNPVAVAEDLAWLASSYPGRVAAGFVAGYQPRDFETLGSQFASRSATFWNALECVSGLLRGGLPEHPAAADRALGCLSDDTRPTLVAGVVGGKGAARAARAGVGLLVTSLTSAARCAELVDIYRDNGGSGVRCLIRRAWAGAPASVSLPMQAWTHEGEGAGWLRGANEELIHGSATAVLDGLVAAVVASGANALNIRINVDGKGPTDTLHQIDYLGEHVLAALRSALGW
jgi:alkanesulfonate monooxygenase SsuD/methylene tetrahydromethanopterin reductase-like flavin-dependent oxidoreductase (luciferase family)